ncbi:sulfurtransferase complex subunit TusC [bacterium SCSIO 12696]|nr:sulfurtransferase complex subunit TusC [bacterium SCSIO 12696]
MSKPLLFVFRCPPYGSSLAREGLEAALATASLGQTVSVLFMDDGVWQLVQQQATVIEQKNISAMASALPLYGVEQCFVDKQSLTVRQLDAETIGTDVIPLDTAAVQSLLANNNHHIVSF